VPAANPGKARNSEFGPPGLTSVNGRARTGNWALPNVVDRSSSCRQNPEISTPQVWHGSSHMPARRRTPFKVPRSNSPPNRTVVPGAPRNPTRKVAGPVVMSGGTVSFLSRHHRYSALAQNWYGSTGAALANRTDPPGGRTETAVGGRGVVDPPPPPADG